MTDEELLAKAKASQAEVPSELAGRLECMLGRLNTQAKMSERQREASWKRSFTFAGIGLAAAAIAAVLVLRAPAVQPKDSFSSPEEAYAMLEATFSHIADKIGSATLTLDGSVQHVEDTFTKVYNR